MKTISLLANGFGFNMNNNWAMSIRQDKLAADLKSFIDQQGYSQPGSSFNKEILQTMEQIHNHPIDKFYKGIIAQKLSKDLFGHLNTSDLSCYQVVEREALLATVGDHQVNRDLLYQQSPTNYLSDTPAVGWVQPITVKIMLSLVRIKSLVFTPYYSP